MGDEKRVALISGCSTGIGRAVALELAQRGLRVWATARRPETLAADAAFFAGTAALDVTDPESVLNVVGEVLAREGRIDLLVNNAGYAMMGPVIEMSPEDFRTQWETNVTGAMTLTNAVVPSMIERRSGEIVNISSISGVLTSPFSGAYCASKAALNSLTDALRLELAPFGIRVVCVQPGGVKSAFGDNATSQVMRLMTGRRSAYEPIRDAIENRARYSQKSAMDTGLFATRLCDAILKPTPGRLVRLGTNAHRYPLLKRLLPEALLDWMLRRMFRLDAATFAR